MNACLSLVFSRLLQESCKTDVEELQRTPSSIFIQNFTLILQLIQASGERLRPGLSRKATDITTAFPKLILRYQRCWDEAIGLLKREIRVRGNRTYILSHWSEPDDLRTLVCNDLVNDGFVTVQNEKLQKLNSELGLLLQRVFDYSLEKAARNSLSSAWSCSGATDASSTTTHRSEMPPMALTPPSSGSVGSSSEAFNSVSYLVEDEDEDSANWDSQSSARTSLLSSLS
ncbi:MAG: hypothetical protein SGCHY_004969 [Lobulomycetales sp.]